MKYVLDAVGVVAEGPELKVNFGMQVNAIDKIFEEKIGFILGVIFVDGNERI